MRECEAALAPPATRDARAVFASMLTYSKISTIRPEISMPGKVKDSRAMRAGSLPRPRGKEAARKLLPQLKAMFARREPGKD